MRFLLAVVLVFISSLSFAQQREPVTFSTPLISRVEGLTGHPFGVGLITFRLPPDAGEVNSSMILKSGAVSLTELNDRVFYQVVGQQALSRFMGNVAKDQVPTDNMHGIWFLFTGNQPLDLTLHGSKAKSIRMIPAQPRRERQFRRRLGQWWREYVRAAEEQEDIGDYPTLIESYLVSMLSQRLALEPPEQNKDRRDPLRKTFDLMFNVEKLRNDMIRDEMLGNVDNGLRDRALPAPIEWEELQAPPPPMDIKVEEMANYVPESCFYLRFGTWANNIWLKTLLEEYGGELGRMFSLRGYESRIDARFLDQLALQSTELEDIFGARAIRDVAFIGMDTYFNDGPSIGVILHAKNTETFKQRTDAKRKAFADSNDDVTLVDVEIAGTTVSFLSTPNNFRRSFYISKDDFHLTTNSRAIVEEFLKHAGGPGSLGKSPQFRYARSVMPLEDDHTIFVFLSSRFFQKLLSPKYQIELRRRNQSIADIQLLQMAFLAASGEKKTELDHLSLINAGFLPLHFGEAQKSGYELINNEWTDSVRGVRGFFKPIPDVGIGAVTPSEFQWFTERANYFTQNIETLDPMFIGIQRFQAENNVERVVVDARVAPFGVEKYGWIGRLLGPPIKNEFAGSPNDIVRFQVSLGQGLFSAAVEPHQIFAGVQDHVDPHIDLQPKSFLDAYQTFREVPGYLGAWPKPDTLRFLPQLGGHPDPYGYTYSRLLKLWRLQAGDYSILSFDQSRLEELKPNLSMKPSERPSHLKVQVGNISESKLRDWANTLNYRRSWQTSLANVKMLNALVNQFRLPPEQALAVAEQMLDVKLLCSLGGEYELRETLSGRKVWTSTQWPNFLNPQMPADYTAPVLNWFRGADIEVTQAETQFALHGYFDIQRAETSGLPSFQLFKGFGNLLGGGEEKKTPEPAGAAEKVPEGNKDP